MRDDEKDQYINHRHNSLVVIEMIKIAGIYGKSFEMAPITIKNRIVFVIYLFSLNLLFARCLLFEWGNKKAP